MATEFLIDGILSGTDVRDVTNGGYVDPISLGLSEQLGQSVSSWQAQCAEAHFAGFANERVTKLDKSGSALGSRIQNEPPDTEVGYFSNGLMKRLDYVRLQASRLRPSMSGIKRFEAGCRKSTLQHRVRRNTALQRYLSARGGWYLRRENYTVSWSVNLSARCRASTR